MKERLPFRIFVYVFLAGGMTLVFIPAYFVFVSSFKSNNEIITSFFALPKSHDRHDNDHQRPLVLERFYAAPSHA